MRRCWLIGASGAGEGERRQQQPESAISTSRPWLPVRRRAWPAGHGPLLPSRSSPRTARARRCSPTVPPSPGRDSATGRSSPAQARASRRKKIGYSIIQCIWGNGREQNWGGVHTGKQRHGCGYGQAWVYPYPPQRQAYQWVLVMRRQHPRWRLDCCCHRQ
jgi:hypothetical protein